MRRSNLAALLALGLAAPVLAWTPLASNQPKWCGPAPYALQEDGSQDLGLSETQRIVQQAMEEWAAPSCSELQLDWNGLTPTEPLNMEGQSIIGWVESGWPYEQYAIGVTVPRWSGDCLVEADMALNAVNFTWTDGYSGGNSVDSYSIVLHEAGHYFGLGHSSDQSATMYYAYSGGVLQLNSDDQAGICTLYPGDGGGGGCNTSGCPDGYVCIDDSCQLEAGSAEICASCVNSAQCGGDNDYCLMYPDGSGYCGRSCSSDADCDGETCASVSGYLQCVRLDGAGEPSCQAAPPPSPECSQDSDCGSGEICDAGDCVAEPDPPAEDPVPPPGCVTDTDCDAGEVCDPSGECVAESTGAALGEACATDGDCALGQCSAVGERSLCTSSCTWSREEGCPAGFYCDRNLSQVCGQGMCLAGGAGELPLGATCARHSDCASLSCDQGSCAQPCLPGDASTCPLGLTCQPGGDGSCGGCAEGAAPPGAVCLVNEDCATELCLSDGEIAFCTQPCGEESPCPDGFNCVGVNDAAKLCLPDELEAARPAVSLGQGLSCASAAPPSPGGIFPLVILIGCALRRRRP